MICVCCYSIGPQKRGLLTKIIGGGSGFYSVYTTNYDDDVPTYSGSSSSSTTTGGSATAASDGKSGSATGQATVTSEATPAVNEADTKKASSSKNTAAIAAGVVVGVVGLAALCGAGFFWWRSKNNKANAAMGAPPGGYGRDSNQPSMSNSRFDGNYMAQRRQSNGSIDDDHDFSRRILQVNFPISPDDFSILTISFRLRTLIAKPRLSAIHAPLLLSPRY